MKVTAILKGMIDSNGHQPIQIRITRGEHRKYIPTHIKVDPDLFEKGKVKKAHPKAAEYNRKLETLIIQYQAQALSGFEKKIPKTSLFDYIEQTKKHLTRKDTTLRQYDSQVNKLREFQPVIYLSEIDHAFFNRYKSFLKARGNEGNTVWSAFKFLKTFINKAVDDGLLPKDPFKKWEFPKYNQKLKAYLTPDEIKLIDKFVRGKVSPDLKEAGVWALIACYSGLRISDIKAFDKKKNIHSGRLVVKTQKTGEVVGIPVSGKLKEYFEMIDYKTLSVTPEHFGRLLKVISSTVGIEKNLHAHLMRHTAAMLLANAGVSQEVTARVLGHASMKTTSIYYKISNLRIDAELKKRK
jgi:integrase/recombinase XerD